MSEFIKFSLAVLGGSIVVTSLLMGFLAVVRNVGSKGAHTTESTSTSSDEHYEAAVGQGV